MCPRAATGAGISHHICDDIADDLASRHLLTPHVDATPVVFAQHRLIHHIVPDDRVRIRADTNIRCAGYPVTGDHSALAPSTHINRRSAVHGGATSLHSDVTNHIVTDAAVCRTIEAYTGPRTFGDHTILNDRIRDLVLRVDPMRPRGSDLKALQRDGAVGSIQSHAV
ncbi:MAG: hypothetical protein BWY82_00134 [Verrucomicrobia bacterium ADurb.Bin474]|nr:MAG: hypothetical protein BWY82_00134 [Verrucomicrobia bacterium ADurb.Bin474]